MGAETPLRVRAPAGSGSGGGTPPSTPRAAEVPDVKLVAPNRAASPSGSPQGTRRLGKIGSEGSGRGVPLALVLASGALLMMVAFMSATERRLRITKAGVPSVQAPLLSSSAVLGSQQRDLYADESEEMDDGGWDDGGGGDEPGAGRRDALQQHIARAVAAPPPAPPLPPAKWQLRCAVVNNLGFHIDVMAGWAYAFQSAGCDVTVYQNKRSLGIEAIMASWMRGRFRQPEAFPGEAGDFHVVVLPTFVDQHAELVQYLMQLPRLRRQRYFLTQHNPDWLLNHPNVDILQQQLLQPLLSAAQRRDEAAAAAVQSEGEVEEPGAAATTAAAAAAPLLRVQVVTLAPCVSDYTLQLMREMAFNITAGQTYAERVGSFRVRTDEGFGGDNEDNSEAVRLWVAQAVDAEVPWMSPVVPWTSGPMPDLAAMEQEAVAAVAAAAHDEADDEEELKEEEEGEGEEEGEVADRKRRQRHQLLLRRRLLEAQAESEGKTRRARKEAVDEGEEEEEEEEDAGAAEEEEEEDSGEDAAVDEEEEEEEDAPAPPPPVLVKWWLEGAAPPPPPPPGSQALALLAALNRDQQDEGPRHVCIQGKLENSRRNYTAAFEALSHPAVLRHLRDSGERLLLLGHRSKWDAVEVPEQLGEVVVTLESLPYSVYFHTLSRCRALLLAFATDEYYSKKSSSTIATALNVGVPLVAERRTLEAYNFLQTEACFVYDDRIPGAAPSGSVGDDGNDGGANKGGGDSAEDAQADSVGDSAAKGKAQRRLLRGKQSGKEGSAGVDAAKHAQQRGPAGGAPDPQPGSYSAAILAALRCESSAAARVAVGRLKEEVMGHNEAVAAAFLRDTERQYSDEERQADAEWWRLRRAEREAAEAGRGE